MMKKIAFLAMAGTALFFACGGDDETGSTAATCDVTTITSLTGNSMLGASTFDSLCGTSPCHGPGGDGGASNAGRLTQLVPTLSTAQIAATVKCGKGAMPPQSLSEQEIADVVAYVEEFCNPTDACAN
jgi:hypothetical protein